MEGEMSTAMNRIGKVGVLGHLDELERLMKEYLRELDSGLNDVLGRQLLLSGFIVWLRQRQRQSVAGDGQ